jgi:hypothetical protein
LPFVTLSQLSSLKIIETNPDVGTFAIKISPNLLTKLVIASLCPKRITFS